MAAREMAAMLDELMGPKRNAELGMDTKVTFDDPDICKFYILGFCPHDMFVNTKIDLGPCPRVHDDNLRIQYPNSPEFEKLGFEKHLLRFLKSLEEDNQKRIARNQDKIKANDEVGQKRVEERRVKDQTELNEIDEAIKRSMQLAEEAGGRGEVALSAELVMKAEALEKDKKNMIERIAYFESMEAMVSAGENLIPGTISHQLNYVCDICGSILIKNDAQCRVEEHLLGKMHTGFQRIRNTIQEFEERLELLAKERNKRVSKDERQRDDKNGDRKRDRRSRSRSRDRDHRHRDRRDDHKDRNRNREHRDRRNRSNSRDRTRRGQYRS